MRRAGERSLDAGRLRYAEIAKPLETQLMTARRKEPYSRAIDPGCITYAGDREMKRKYNLVKINSKIGKRETS